MLTVPVRLSHIERATLTQLFQKYLAVYPDARVYLFGSRADLNARGGDLDLLIVLTATAEEAYQLRRTLIIAIKDELGDQRIDLILSTEKNPSAFVRLAMLDGVVIWS